MLSASLLNVFVYLVNAGKLSGNLLRRAAHLPYDMFSLCKYLIFTLVLPNLVLDCDFRVHCAIS